MKTIANTDWYLRRGIEHSMTEDYTLTNDRELVFGNDGKLKNIPGPIKGNPFAIVCDGCSSSPHTDIGARVLAHQAKLTQALSGFGDDPITRFGFYMAVWGASYATCKNLGLPSAALDATLLTAYVNEDGKYRACALGDGVFAWKTKTGDVVILEISFPSNAPVYLRLLADGCQYKRYCEQFGRIFKVTTSTLTPSGDSYEVVSEMIDEAELCQAGRFLWTESSPVPGGFDNTTDSAVDVDVVAVFTDGVSSFQQYNRTATGTTVKPVSTKDIVWEVMSFRRYGGNFVQARCNRAFTKFEKLNWRNVDDFSMAAIHVEKKEETDA